ncbi:MAG: hypothetical protein IJY39_12665 [Clostridia bacterium]|nr:hypothetical protein [Clostridia bacterium]
MKKILCLILLCVIAVSTIACSNGEAEGKSSDTVAKVLNPIEYSIYLNVFQNGEGNSYANKTYTKEGVFAILHDSYNNKTRYYVWGYSDKTLCCDWQWEFVPTSTDELPPIGSRVKVSGKFVENDSALDGYWMENAIVEVVVKYEASIGDYDTITMSPTLTRVQVVNMLNHASEYAGQSIKIYGRVMSGGKIQHPYYDGAWSLPLEYDGDLPAIGTWITVTGKFSGSSASDSKVIVESITIDG